MGGTFNSQEARFRQVGAGMAKQAGVWCARAPEEQSSVLREHDQAATAAIQQQQLALRAEELDQQTIMARMPDT